MAAGQNKAVAIKFVSQSVRPGVLLEAVFTANSSKKTSPSPPRNFVDRFGFCPPTRSRIAANGRRASKGSDEVSLRAGCLYL